MLVQPKSVSLCLGSVLCIHPLLLRLGLLLELCLNTALRSLALVVLSFIRSLGLLVTSQAGKGTTDGASNAVADTVSKIGNLTLGFLALALLVLSDALLLETLCAEETSNCLLSSTDSLVPGSFSAVRRFGGDTRSRHIDGADRASSVRKVLLDVGFILPLFALSLCYVSQAGGRATQSAYLVGSGAGEATKDRLGSACSRVDVGLESGSLLVRHGWYSCDGLSDRVFSDQRV